MGSQGFSIIGRCYAQALSAPEGLPQRSNFQPAGSEEQFNLQIANDVIVAFTNDGFSSAGF